MLSTEERRTLKALDAELTRRYPELAAALSFGYRPRRRTAPSPRGRRVFGAVAALATVGIFVFAWLWGSGPAAPCLPGQDMTDRAAIAAAADLSRPMPDNVGCVVPGPARAN